MCQRSILAGTVALILLCAPGLQAQQSDSRAPESANLTPVSPPAAGTVPRLIKFTGIVKDLAGEASAATVGLTFSLYELPEGGDALWTETQSLTLDSAGHYTALLGATTAEGLPLDLFTSSKALWLGVQLAGQAEQPRVLLVAVPYALKSSDADTLGGLPASAFMLAPSANAAASTVTPNLPIIYQPPGGAPAPPPGSPSGSAGASITGGGTPNYVPVFTGVSTIGNSSTIYNSSSGLVGINTTNPGYTLDVNGVLAIAGRPFLHSCCSLNASNVFVGGAGNFTTTGEYNTVTGFGAVGSNTTGGGNTASGVWALENNTMGNANTASGLYALYSNTTGNLNTAVGYNAGFNGFISRIPTTGNNSTFVGAFATATVDNLSNATAIGYNAQVGEPNALVLGATQDTSGNPLQTNVGIGTPTPQYSLDVVGSIRLGTQALQPGQGQTVPSGTLIFSDGTMQTTAYTGSSGGGITRVTAGTGLMGGGTGTSGNVTLAVDPAQVPLLGTPNRFTADQSVTGNINATGSLSAGEVNVSGNINAMGVLQAVAVDVSGNIGAAGTLIAGGANITGNVNATGSLTAGSATLTGGLTGATGNFTGALTAAGAVLPATGTATSDSPFSSSPLELFASSFNGTNAVSEQFRWQAEGNGSSDTGTLNLLAATGSTSLQETGLSIASNGQISFAPGQTFPVTGTGGGTVTGVTAGAGLMASPSNPITTSGTISIAPGGVTNAMLATPSITVSTGPGLSGGGSVPLGSAVTINNTGVLSILPSTGIIATGGPTPTLSIDPTVVPTVTGPNTFANTLTINSGDVSLNAGNLDLIGTTGATAGVITSGGTPFIHECCGYTSNGYTFFSNTFVGLSAGNFTNTGMDNTGIGTQALNNIAAGTTGIAVATGNTASGAYALSENTTGNYNTATGFNALQVNETGSYNTAVGYSAGYYNPYFPVTGSFSTFIGAYANPTGNYINATAIGSGAEASNNNVLVLGCTTTCPGGTNPPATPPNVGIGTANPLSTLDVRGTGSFSTSVGIGTTSPAYTLDVQGTGNFTGAVNFGGAVNFASTVTLPPSALTNLNASNLTSGTVPSAVLSGYYSGLLTLANTSNDIFGNFEGNGAGLYNVNANTLNGLSVAAFPVLNQSNTFTATNTFAADQMIMGSANVDSAGTNTGTETPGVTFGKSGGGESISSDRVGSVNLFGLDFYTDFNPRMSITQGGYVGIGTQAPTGALTVFSNVNPADGIDVTAHNAPVGSGNSGTNGIVANGGYADPSAPFQSGVAGGDGVDAFGGNAQYALAGAGIYALGGNGYIGGDGISASAGSNNPGGIPGRAGIFSGDVEIIGNLSKSGGSFKIDHPLDPANKYLYHSFVESPDMKNIYDGVVTLDDGGEAEVELPEWFETLNRDFRYQLTCIGGYAPVYIAQEVAGNTFKIAGGKAGLKVSWQVTGIRQDAWANAHRIPVEADKPTREQGYYLHPELYGAPEEKGIEWARRPQMMKRLKEMQAKAAQSAASNPPANVPARPAPKPPGK